MRASFVRAAAATAAALAFLSCAETPTAPERAALTRSLPLAQVTAPSVVISQIYGGGGNAGAAWRNDFIELFNTGPDTVSLAGWSVQYASATGTTWTVTPLSGSIAPGGYYLIQQAAGANTAGTAVALPTPDASGSIAMSGTAGKVALASSVAPLSGACPTGGSVIQAIGFGTTASCPNPTATLSNTTAAIRRDGGCAFTDNATADFEVAAPTPRNTASPRITCRAPGVPVLLVVTPDTASVVATASVAFTAQVFDAADSVVGPGLIWSTLDTTIATVSASGVVTGVRAGTTSVIARIEAGLADTATVIVTPAPALPDVVISQVYGGGGNSGSFWRSDFVELYNRGAEPVDLTGWSVQYASATGTSWQVTVLSGTIEPGKYYLVQQATGTGGTQDLPTPEALGTIAMAAGSAKVLLSTAAAPQSGACPVGPEIADRLTYGNSNCASAWGNGAPTASAANAVLRVNDGCVDTGVAAADFVALLANPRNGAAPRRDCVEPPRNQSAATVAINELMGDPAAAESASWGEWFELLNFGTEPVDLQGWRIVSGGTSQPAHVIASSVVIPPGGVAVLGRGGDPLRNGGVTLDYNYFAGSATTIWLDNADYLILVDAAGDRVDSVAWTSLPRGVAKGLRPGTARAANVDGADWGFAGTTFGDGDYGTPGAQNAGLVDTPPFVSANRIDFVGRLLSDPPLPIGFEDQLFANVRDPGNVTIPSTITWTSLTPATASVDARGVIRALAPGNATFRAVAEDGTARNITLPMGVPTASSVTYANPAEFGLPVDSDPSDDFLVARREFTSSWNGARGIPNWAAYNLVGEHVGAGADRCDCFTFDPQLEAAGFAPYNTADYTGAGDFAGYGIARGHLVRSFDRTAGTADNAATYLFSNIIPQAADNNSGPWANHENFLGDLARVDGKELFIYTGGAGSVGTVKGEGRITIPAWTWKVSVVVPRGTRLANIRDYRDLQVIAVVMPNVPGIASADWATQYVVTADSVERLTGYRFLNALPERIRRPLLTGTQPPIGAIAPASGTEGVPLTFDAAASVDPNGTIVGYAWDFGDGNGGSGVAPSHVYQRAGTYTVRLVTTDNDGLVDSVSAVVSVAAVTPLQGVAQVRDAAAALVQALEARRIVERSLLVKAQLAEAAILRGNPLVARLSLGALRLQLRALVQARRATPEQVAATEQAIDRTLRALR
jgi:DNA/RNA endonuclease G (NUC1)